MTLEDAKRIFKKEISNNAKMFNKLSPVLQKRARAHEIIWNELEKEKNK